MTLATEKDKHSGGQRYMNNLIGTSLVNNKRKTVSERRRQKIKRPQTNNDRKVIEIIRKILK